MTTGGLISLSVIGLLFAIWTGAMFFILFKLGQDTRARREADPGGMIRDYKHTLATFRDFAIAPQYRIPRLMLAALTFLLFFAIAINVALFSAP